MGRDALQRGNGSSDREIARHKNFLSDITGICIFAAFVFFVIGFASAAAPIPTAVVCWAVAGICMICALVLAAVNHFG